MISIDEQRNLLVEIGNKLPKEIIAYAIGGTAMMFLGFKESTKDIDLVFSSLKDMKLFKGAAESMGYSEMDSVIVYGIKNNKPVMISLGESRLDLFVVDIIDFTFSENMQKRAVQTHQFGKNLFIKIADKHDIILMKCAANRLRDEDDIVNIAKNSEINWDILIEEAKTQVKLGRERAFLEMGFLAEKLAEKYKIHVPKQAGDILFDLLKKQADQKKKHMSTQRCKASE